MSEAAYSEFDSYQPALIPGLKAVELDEEQLEQNRNRLQAKNQIGLFIHQLQLEREHLSGTLEAIQSSGQCDEIRRYQTDELFARYLPMVSWLRDQVRDTSASAGGFVVLHDVETEDGVVESTLTAISHCEYEVRDGDASTLVGWGVGNHDKFDFTLDQIVIE